MYVLITVLCCGIHRENDSGTIEYGSRRVWLLHEYASFHWREFLGKYKVFSFSIIHKVKKNGPASINLNLSYYRSAAVWAFQNIGFALLALYSLITPHIVVKFTQIDLQTTFVRRSCSLKLPSGSDCWVRDWYGISMVTQDSWTL